MGWIIDYGPHIHCTSLDDNCLVAGFSCLLKDYLHQGLEEAPKTILSLIIYMEKGTLQLPLVSGLGRKLVFWV